MGQGHRGSRHASICLVTSLLLFGIVAGGFAVSKRIYVVDAVIPPVSMKHVPLQEFLLMYVVFLGLVAAGYAASRQMTGLRIFAFASWMLLILTTMVFKTPCNAGEFFYSYLTWTTVVGFLIARSRVPGNARWFLAFRILFIVSGPVFFVPRAYFHPSHYFLGFALCLLPLAGIGALQRRNTPQTT